MFKRILLPIILFVVIAGGSILIFDGVTLNDSVLGYVLFAEVFVLLYYWYYHINKSKKSGIYFIYLSAAYLAYFLFTMIIAFVYASGNMGWTAFLVIYFLVLAAILAFILFLNFMYGGLNDSLKNQDRGEHSLAKMREICQETMFVLDQYKKDASEPIAIYKEVAEALEYSDPVSHKKVYPIERQIMSGLKTGLSHAKNKHFGKIKAVLKDSSGVLFLIEKRNRVLKDNK